MKFDFNFLKDRYDYELKRKDQITAALTLPVGVLTLMRHFSERAMALWD